MNAGNSPSTWMRNRGTLNLGLAMVQSFVAQALGALRIESRPGKGTTFSLILPRATGEGWMPSKPGEPDADNRPITRSFETILLVDDDPEVLGIAAVGLEEFGFEILIAPMPAPRWTSWRHAGSMRS